MEIDDERICDGCGGDLAAEGQAKCTDCLEAGL